MVIIILKFVKFSQFSLFAYNGTDQNPIVSASAELNLSVSSTISLMRPRTCLIDISLPGSNRSRFSFAGRTTLSLSSLTSFPTSFQYSSSDIVYKNVSAFSLEVALASMDCVVASSWSVCAPSANVLADSINSNPLIAFFMFLKHCCIIFSIYLLLTVLSSFIVV